MYMNSNMERNTIDLSQYCTVKVIEVCTHQIKIGNHPSILLCTLRTPSGNFSETVVQLDLILKYLYKPKLEFIICGDFNVNFLIYASSARQPSFAIL